MSPRHALVRPVALGVMLAGARLPFALAHPLQDDAFITWRCALQLADTGVYGFNAGERVSASTSHAYVLAVALLRLVFGSSYLGATLAMNTVLTVAALFLVSSALFEDARLREACWALSALTPMAIVVSISGMETGLLLFTMGVALFALERPRRGRWELVALALLPWVRLDALFLAGAMVLAYGCKGDRGRRVMPLLATLFGLGTVLAFNRLYFGSFLNQSIVAKLAGLHASHDFVDVIGRVVGVYFGTRGNPSELSPLPTRYLSFLGPVFAGLTFLGFGIALRARADRRRALVALAIVCLVSPAVYGAAAVFYGWYFWPAILLSGVVLLGLALETSARASRAWLGRATVGLGILVAGGASLEWALAVSATSRASYTADVGHFVAASARPGDTLFSDMAGSVPYHAGLPTEDTVGLVSPRITRYQRAYGDAWWPAFARERAPTWVVLRDPIDSLLAGASDADVAWAHEGYTLVKQFHYGPDPSLGPLRRRLASLGSAYDFFVYRRRD